MKSLTGYEVILYNWRKFHLFSSALSFPDTLIFSKKWNGPDFALYSSNEYYSDSDCVLRLSSKISPLHSLIFRGGAFKKRSDHRGIMYMTGLICVSVQFGMWVLVERGRSLREWSGSMCSCPMYCLFSVLLGHQSLSTFLWHVHLP